MATTELMPHQTARMIVENVDQARQDVLEAFKLLDSAKQRLGAVLGAKDCNSYNSLWRDRIYCDNLMKTAQDCDAFIARNAWRYLLAQTGMLAYMTDARQKELQGQLDNGQFPALTVENILSSMEGLTGQLGSLLIESVKEVFDWLRPWHSGYKTNKKFTVGRKVIIGYMLNQSWAGADFHINYSRANHIKMLGNVFSLLDGQGVPQYPHDLPTQMNTALKGVRSGESFTVPYMTGKPYGNGNLHLAFTRMDLVDKLNQLGSDGSLGEKESGARTS